MVCENPTGGVAWGQCVDIWMSVRNIVIVTFRKNVISIGILENLKSTFDVSRISRASEGGRPNAPKIATTTEYCPSTSEYCPGVGPSVGFAHASKIYLNLIAYILINVTYFFHFLLFLILTIFWICILFKFYYNWIISVSEFVYLIN